MHFVEQLSVASALISLASGSPVEKRGLDFSIKQTVPKPFIKTGPAAVAAVYKKYDATAPADVSQRRGSLPPFSLSVCLSILYVVRRHVKAFASIATLNPSCLGAGRRSFQQWECFSNSWGF